MSENWLRLADAAQDVNPFGDRIHKFDLLAVLRIEHQLQLIEERQEETIQIFASKFKARSIYRG